MFYGVLTFILYGEELIVLETESKYIGYEWFLRERGIKPLVWKSSSYLAKSQYEASKLNALAQYEGRKGVQYIYNKKYLDNYESLGAIDHLEIAIRFEPLDLYSLSKIVKSLEHGDVLDLEGRLKESSSLPLRRIGYYYEVLTNKELHVNPISTRLSIEELVDPSRYYTAVSQSSKKRTVLEEKWRITDNTLGKLGVFAPIISREGSMRQYTGSISAYSNFMDEMPTPVKNEMLDRLYAADSIASFEIEGDPLSEEDARFKRFVKALREIKEAHLTFDEHELSRLQRICVDAPDKAANGYRTFQNAIGGRPGAPAYICPPPTEVDRMMQAISYIHENIGSLPPVVAAAAVSGAFVLVHPFADGNGRISRLLISDALARGYNDAPIIPICLGIKEHREEYIATLAKLTGPIMKRTNFTIEDNHYKLVDTDTDMFRYPDLTGYTEFLNRALQDTLEVQVPREAEKTRLTLYLSAVFQDSGLHNIEKKDRDIIIASIVNNRGRLSNGLEKKLLKRNVCTEEQIDILRDSLTEREKLDTDPEMFTER